MRFRLAILAALLIPAVSLAADEKSYAIKMERTSRVGDRTKVEAMGAYHTKMRVQVGDAEPKTVEEAVGIRLEGTSEVKEVAKDGRRTKVAVTVKECALMVGDKSKTLLADGDVIDVRWEKDATKYSVQGKDIPEELSEAFDLILELNDPQGATDDEVFRTKEPRKKGDTWSIDPAIAKKELARIGLKTDEEELWGESTLQELSKIGDRDCVKLKTSFKAKDMSGPGRRANEKMKLDTGTLTVESTLMLPLDDKQPPAREEVKITTTGELSGTNDDGKPVRVARVSERVVERTTGPLETKE